MLSVFSKLDDNKEVVNQLLERIRHSGSTGLVFVAKSLSVSANIKAKQRPDDILMDACLLTREHPTVILTIAKSAETNTNLQESKLYVLSLAKGLTQSVRRFTDEPFSALYGVLREEDVFNQERFDSALVRLRDELSRICVPESLKMTEVKYEGIVRAFLYSLSVTNHVVTDDRSKVLSLLTFEQFSVIAELIDKMDEVTVYTSPHTGKGVVLREIANRLQKGGSTILLLKVTTKDMEFAKDVCSKICTLDELKSEPMKEELGFVNLVTDCERSDIGELFSQVRRSFFFLPMPGNSEISVDQSDTAEHRTNSRPDDDGEISEEQSWAVQIRTNSRPDEVEGSIVDRCNQLDVDKQDLVINTEQKQRESWQKQDSIIQDDDDVGSSVDTGYVQLTPEKGQQRAPRRAISLAVMSIVRKHGETVNTLKENDDVFEREMSLGNIQLNEPISSGSKRQVVADQGEIILGLPQSVQEETLHTNKEHNLLKARTLTDIDVYTRDTVKPELLSKAKIKLEKEKVITITGAPGEGKTTLAYMLLKEFKSDGWTPFSLKSPIDLRSITEFSKTVFFLNDIFGSIQFDENETKLWIPILHDIQKYMSSFQLMLIIVSRDYVLEEARPHLSRMTTFISSGYKELNISKEVKMSDDDKIAIFKQYAKKREYDETDLKQLVKIAFPYGFPYCCFLYFKLEDTNRPLLVFFKKAQQFLDETTESILTRDQFKKAAFYLLLYEEGSVSCSVVRATDRPSRKQMDIIHLLSIYTHDQEINPGGYLHKLHEAFERLDGFYIKRGIDSFIFSHPAFFESVTRVVGKTNMSFLIESCPMKFLRSSVTIPREFFPLLTQRLYDELIVGNISLSLSHPLFRSELGLQNILGESLAKILMTRDILSEKSFISLVPSTGSTLLLSRLISSTDISKEMFLELVRGCCEFGNLEGLKLLLKTYTSYFEKNSAMSLPWIALENQHWDTLRFVTDLQDDDFDMNSLLIKSSSHASEDILSFLLEKGACVNAEDKEGTTALFNACKHGNQANTVYLIQKGSETGKRTFTGDGPIHVAAREAHARCVESLIQFGANVNDTGGHGLAPLHIAASHGNIDVVKKLVEKKCQLNIKRSDGKTALHIACGSGHFEIVNLLLQNRCDVDIMDSMKCTPLHESVKAKCKPAVQLLVDHGANVNVCNQQGQSPLFITALSGSDEIASLLVENGANVDGTRNHTPLHICCLYNHLKMARLLLQKGANVNRRTNNGETPLILAVRSNVEQELVKCLLHFRATVNSSRRDGWSVLQLAVWSGNFTVVQMITCAGADVNGEGVNGVTPLALAAYTGQMKIVHFLIEHGARVAHVMKNGMTSFSYAARNGHTQIMSLLFEKGGGSDTPNADGRHPLHLAVIREQVDSVKTLIGLGVNIDSRLKDGKTSLMLASDGRNEQFVLWLLEAGADITLTDNRKWSCYHFAAQGGNVEIMKCLLYANKYIDLRTVEGYSVFLIAMSKSDPEIVHMLLTAGCDPLLVGLDNRNALHFAAEGNHRHNILLALSLGFDVNSVTNRNQTPLHIAVLAGNVGIITELLDRGASVNAQDVDKSSPLSQASTEGSAQIVKILLSRGADVNHVVKRGDTSLHLACMNGHVDVVHELLEAGADPNAYNVFGLTPLHISAFRGNNQIVKSLLQHGAKSSLLGTFGMHVALFAHASKNYGVQRLLNVDEFTEELAVTIERFLARKWNEACIFLLIKTTLTMLGI